jgi:hypothetical protein
MPQQLHLEDLWMRAVFHDPFDDFLVKLDDVFMIVYCRQ